MRSMRYKREKMYTTKMDRMCVKTMPMYSLKAPKPCASFGQGIQWRNQ